MKKLDSAIILCLNWTSGFSIDCARRSSLSDMKRIIIDSNLDGVIAGNTTGTAGLLEFEEAQPRMSTRKLAE